jgi:hypothetical protein
MDVRVNISHFLIKEEKEMSNFKKLVAVGIVSTMIMGSTVTSFATETTTDLSSASTGTVAGAEQTVTGTGTEAFVFKKAFKVTVPTAAEAAKLVSFYSDPLGLIAETNAAQVGTDVTITNDTGILFKNTDSAGKVTLSDWSDPIKIVNKSTSGVEISITATLKEATTDKYAGGYSTTADFKGSGDSAKGLYLGLWTTGCKDNAALSDSASTIKNYAKSAYSLYEVTYVDGTGYKFEIPSADVDKAPVFEIYATGALNKQLADSTWYKATDGQPLTSGAAYAMPDIEIKYTPTYVDGKPAKTELDAQGLWVWNYDDSPFAAEAALADAKINDTAVSLATGTKTSADGYALIPIANVYTALGLTADADKTVAKAKEMLQGVEISVGGVLFYGDCN